MWRRYADGIDYVDIIGATAPKPTLVMAGKGDEVFRIEDTTALAETARNLFRAGGWEDRFDFFADESGHAYTLAQAEQFVAFMDKWLSSGNRGKKSERRIWPVETFRLNPYPELQCEPSQDVNMRTLSLDRAEALRADRTSREIEVSREAKSVCSYLPDTYDPTATEVGPPFRAWVHDLHQVRLITETDIELHGSLLVPSDRDRAPGPLHFDDQGRNRLLEAGGLLSRVIRFVDRVNPGFSCFSVDLRGWGDTRPAMLPFEIPSWGSTDRFFAYSTAALGDGTLQMRIRDGLTALAFLRQSDQTRDCPVVVSGCGLGGIVAAHVAAIDPKAAGIVVWDTLRAFEDLLRAEDTAWSPEVFMPGVLERYDIPDLLKVCSGPVRWINPLDAMKERFDEPELLHLAEMLGNGAEVSNGDEEAIFAALQGVMDGVDEG